METEGKGRRILCLQYRRPGSRWNTRALLSSKDTYDLVLPSSDVGRGMTPRRRGRDVTDLRIEDHKPEG